MIDWLIVPPRRIYSSPSQLWSYLSPCHLTHLWYLLQNNGHESKMFHRAFITYKIATFQPHLNLPSSILPFSHMPSYSQPPNQIWWSTVSRQRKAQYLERGTLAVRRCISPRLGLPTETGNSRCIDLPYLRSCNTFRWRGGWRMAQTTKTQMD